MMFFRFTLGILSVLLSFQMGFSQSALSKEDIINFSSEDIDRLNFEAFTIADFSKTFDVAEALINDSTNTDYRIKGTNVLAALAKELHLKIKHKQFDLDAADTEMILRKFETQSYYISRPTPGQFLKLMKYTCQGDYTHIYDRFQKSPFFEPSISALVIYAFVLIFCIVKRKHGLCLRFVKLSVIGLILFVSLVVIFKFTCDNNIKDYSFYGISM